MSVFPPSRSAATYSLSPTHLRVLAEKSSQPLTPEQCKEVTREYNAAKERLAELYREKQDLVSSGQKTPKAQARWKEISEEIKLLRPVVDALLELAMECLNIGTGQNKPRPIQLNQTLSAQDAKTLSGILNKAGLAAELGTGLTLLELLLAL